MGLDRYNGSYVVLSKNPILKYTKYSKDINVINISKTGEQSYGVVLEIISKVEYGNALNNINLHIGAYKFLNLISKPANFVTYYIAKVFDGFKAYAESTYNNSGYCEPRD